MTVKVLLHFGSPKNRDEVGPFLKDILADYCKPLSIVALPFARRSAVKKYEAVGFKGSQGVENLAGKLGKSFILAARYGRPSIKDALKIVDGTGPENVTVLPLFPHASLEMFDSIVQEFMRLERSSYHGMHFRWTGPFFDHPLFIDAWTDSIKKSLDEFESRDSVHIIFSAHAIPDGDNDYEHQVMKTAELITSSLGSLNPSSVAYQSAMRIGKWSRPSIEEEIRKLALGGVSACLIVPVSFLFDNVETLFDIDRSIIPAAKIAGMKDIRRAAPPGDSEKIVEMFEDIINTVPPLCKGRLGGVDLPPPPLLTKEGNGLL